MVRPIALLVLTALLVIAHSQTSSPIYHFTVVNHYNFAGCIYMDFDVEGSEESKNTLLVDTGSAFVWAPGQGCEFYYSNENAGQCHVYNQNGIQFESGDVEEESELTYGSQTVDVNVVEATLSFPGGEVSQSVGLSYYEQSHRAGGSKSCDGIVGMSLNMPEELPFQTQRFTDTMVEAGLIQHNMFALTLGRQNPTDSGVKPTGLMSVGDIGESNYDWTQASSLYISYMTLGNGQSYDLSSLSCSEQPVVLDSGTEGAFFHPQIRAALLEELISNFPSNIYPPQVSDLSSEEIVEFRVPDNDISAFPNITITFADSNDRTGSLFFQPPDYIGCKSGGCSDETWMFSWLPQSCESEMLLGSYMFLGNTIAFDLDMGLVGFPQSAAPTTSNDDDDYSPEEDLEDESSDNSSDSSNGTKLSALEIGLICAVGVLVLALSFLVVRRNLKNKSEEESRLVQESSTKI